MEESMGMLEVNNTESLKEQIILLTERVELLEKRDRRRRAWGWAKVLIKVLLVAALIFGVYQGYQYVVNELPKILEEKVKEVGKEKTDDIKDTINGIFNKN